MTLKGVVLYQSRIFYPSPLTMHFGSAKNHGLYSFHHL